MSILNPLAARYADWLRLPAAATSDVSAEDPAQVRAEPLIMRIERAEPPSRTALLEAAAAASLAVCLDPRATDQDGEWHAAVAEWVVAHIRKVARRARGAHWAAVQELPGVTVTVDGASVRALVPGRVVDTPKEVSRLQIAGSDLPADEPGAPAAGVPVLWLNPSIEMTAGKAAAQVGHAAMLLAALWSADGTDLTDWAATDYRCAVRTGSADDWAKLHPGDDPAQAWRSRGVVAVRDAGFTEVAPGTVTVLAQRP
ncbi:aminoacyl-tRNA hydrolase [Actinophytocola sediminis]